MRILIVGVNGFIGRAVAACSAANGTEVFGLSRSDNPSCAIEATYLVGDRNSPKAILEIIAARNIDVVVDVRAMTLAETRALLLELDGRIAQYVMLSSSDVYRNYELLHRKAAGTPITDSVDEDSALRGTRYPYRSDPRRAADDPDRYLDEYDKIPIEQAVRGLGTAWTILRLPMVYGPGDQQRRFRWAIGHQVKSDEPLVIPRAWAEFITTYGYVENVASGIALSVGNERALNRVFNIGENVPVNHLEWAERIASVVGWDGDIEVSDDLTTDFAQRLKAIDLAVPFKIDSGRIRKELGYAESVAVSDGLELTVSDEQNRG